MRGTFAFRRERSARPYRTRGLLLGSLLILAVPPGASAGGGETVVATDFVLPIWQGTRTSAPSLGHQIDCSSGNPWFWSGGCTVSIYTRGTGTNCLAEIVTNPASGITGAQVYRDTSCQIRLDGTMFFAQATASTCVLVAGGLTLTAWQSGVSSLLFSHQGTVFAVLAKPTGPAELTLTVYSPQIPGPGHHVRIDERFVARFNWPVGTCPGPDVLNMKANLYDPVADTDLEGSDGYLQDTLSLD